MLLLLKILQNGRRYSTKNICPVNFKLTFFTVNLKFIFKTTFGTISIINN